MASYLSLVPVFGKPGNPTPNACCDRRDAESNLTVSRYRRFHQTRIETHRIFCATGVLRRNRKSRGAANNGNNPAVDHVENDGLHLFAGALPRQSTLTTIRRKGETPQSGGRSSKVGGRQALPIGFSRVHLFEQVLITFFQVV